MEIKRVTDLQRFINLLTRDKSLRIVTGYHELNNHIPVTVSDVAQLFQMDKGHIQRIITAGGNYWTSKIINMEERNKIRIPDRITADQFGCNDNLFKNHVKGKWLEIEKENQWFVYVLVQGESYGVHRGDLVSDEDYRANKVIEQVNWEYKKTIEKEGLDQDKAA